MRVLFLGRTEWLFETIKYISKFDYIEVVGVISLKESPDYKINAKSNYHDAKKLKNFINKEKVGTKDFLISQLEKAQKNNYEHKNLKELII